MIIVIIVNMKLFFTEEQKSQKNVKITLSVKFHVKIAYQTTFVKQNKDLKLEQKSIKEQ